MALVSVRCQNCGAPLDVPPEARFLTCAHCSSQLEVHHDSSASYTTLLEKLDRNVSATARDVEVIKLQNELELIDREWQMERESYMTSDKYGRRSLPSRTGSIVGSLVAVVFGIFWVGLAGSMNAPAFFPLFGLVFIGIGVANGISSFTKADRHDSAAQSYQLRRRAMLSKLQKSDRTNGN